jgi:hypothetical protein
MDTWWKGEAVMKFDSVSDCYYAGNILKEAFNLGMIDKKAYDKTAKALDSEVIRIRTTKVIKEEHNGAWRLS